MRELEYFLVCESVTLDQMQRKETLINVLRHIAVQSVPAQIYSVMVACAWRDDSEVDPERSEDHVRLDVISPSANESQIVNPFRRTLSGVGRFETTFFGVLNIPIPVEGDLVFELFVNDESKAKHVIAIEVNQDLVTPHPLVLYPESNTEPLPGN